MGFVEKKLMLGIIKGYIRFKQVSDYNYTNQKARNPIPQVKN